MPTFKEEIEPIAIKNKFWFAIKRMSDEEILEFLKEDVFICDDLTLDFDEAKERCELCLGASLDKMMSKQDQIALYMILQKYS